MSTMRFNKSYEHPLKPFEVSGQRYALPSDFVDGLSFLRRFVRKGPLVRIDHTPYSRDWNFVESRVHIFDGTLYLLTNNLIVSYEIGECDMPNFSFDVRAIRTIEAFGTPPSSVVIDRFALFQWDDGQDLRLEASPIDDSLAWSGLNDLGVAALKKYWRDFSKGVKPSDKKRAEILGQIKGSRAVFLHRDGIVTCASSDGENWTAICPMKFATSLKRNRNKRVEPKAFASMMQIADEIAFDSNPISFRHANGRGILVERTLGSNVPDFDEESA